MHPIILFVIEKEEASMEKKNKKMNSFFSLKKLNLHVYEMLCYIFAWKSKFEVNQTCKIVDNSIQKYFIKSSKHKQTA